MAGIFDVFKNIFPKGTVFGNLLGSNREKGTGFFGIHIGPKEYRKEYASEDATSDENQKPKPLLGPNALITGLLIIVAGVILFRFIK